MSFQVLAKAEKSRIMLLPLRDGTALFEGFLRLKDMPQGPRAFKFLVKTDAEKYFPPEDAIKLLRQAGAIFIARGEESMEKKFLQLLDAYQLGHRRILVCNHCLGEQRFTPIGNSSIAYKGAKICENCAAKELVREADFRGLSRAAKAHLARMLRKRRNLDEVLGLLSLERLDPELTKFDTIPASREETTMDLEAMELPEKLKIVLQRRLTKLLPVQTKSIQAGLLEGKS